MSNAIDLIVQDKAIKGLDGLIVKLQKAHEEIQKINAKGIEFNKSSNNGGLKSTITLTEEYNKLVKQTEKATIQSKLAEEGLNKELLKAKATKNALNKATRTQIKSELDLAGAFAKLTAKLSLAEKKYKDLAVSQGLSNKQTIQAQKEVLKLRNQIDKINTPIKRFSDNVGNYPKMLGSATRSLSGFMSAFGVVGGVYLFASAIKNTFNRVKEFDKEMQNMAGILRTDRTALKNIETTIKAVASVSTKTANEVAKLATSLFALGKTEEEVQNMLKATNDLSIALNASSDEAGEFLVQTMNAFGASSDEAEHYADVIAGIRTSTSLDFQKMRDSFQYILPVSRLLNKDLEYTGALLGVVADSGIKAEQAGRLLASAQMRLASSGKTLQDGLDSINNAIKNGVKETELLGIATKVFGVNAAKVGVTLAVASEKVGLYEKRIRSSGGALDDLVNQQLESLDAKVKILDSTWEDFVLSIENGNGAISAFFVGVTDFLTKAIQGFKILNQTQAEFLDSSEASTYNNAYKEIKKTYKEMGEDAKRLAITEADNSRDKIDEINSEIKALKLKNELIRQEQKQSQSAKRMRLQGGISTNETRIEFLRTSLGYNKAVLKASEEILEITIKENESESKSEETQIRNVKRLRELISLEQDRLKLSSSRNEAQPIQDNIKNLQAEIDAILGVESKKKRLKEKSVVLDMKEEYDAIEQLTKAYEKLQEPLHESTAEYKAIQEMIDALNLVITPNNLLLDEQYDKKVKDAEASKKQREELLRLQKATEDYLNSISLGKLSELGMGSLQTFFDGSFDALLKGADTMEEKFAVSFNAISEVAKEAFSLINSFGQQNFDAEYERINNMEQIRLQFANGSATAEAEISRQAEAQRKQVQKREAEANKKSAMFNIGISTAQGIVSALAMAPPNPILAGIIAGIGATQLAVVASQQLPQFKDGVRDFSGGMAIVGDGGVQEVIETRDGISLTPKTDTLVNLPKGANVYKNKQEFFNERMNNVLINNGIQPITNVRQQNGFDEEKLANLIGKQIKKIPRGNAVMNFDQKGINTYWDNGITKKKMLNSRVRGLGRNT